MKLWQILAQAAIAVITHFIEKKRKPPVEKLYGVVGSKRTGS